MVRNENEYARKTLEYFFDLPLSLGDRMLLRQSVQEATQDKAAIKDLFSPSNFQVAEEAVMRYLGKFYELPMSNNLMFAARGYFSEPLNRLLRERRLFWERD